MIRPRLRAINGAFAFIALVSSDCSSSHGATIDRRSTSRRSMFDGPKAISDGLRRVNRATQVFAGGRPGALGAARTAGHGRTKNKFVNSRLHSVPRHIGSDA